VLQEPDYIPISYLSQYWFCPRRAGLLLLEQVWSDNEYTVEGTEDHKRVHEIGTEKRGSCIKIYDFALKSDFLRLRGYCDCIEATQDKEGANLPNYPGYYKLYPIEYKHGVIRNEIEYNIQLCAQAMCLEDMFDIQIDKGAVFYTDSHRRVEIYFDDRLRNMVKEGAKALFQMLESFHIPLPEKAAKCRKCSLYDFCLPDVQTSASEYLKKIIDDLSRDEDII